MTAIIIKRTALTLIFLISLFQVAWGEGADKRWSIEPAVSIGGVYEFVEDASLYTGGKITVRYASERVVFKGLYRLDDYQMTYYASPMNSVYALITSGVPAGPLLQKVKVPERKEDVGLLLGRRFGDGLYLLAGGRQITLRNDFSTMMFAGPALDAEGSWSWGDREVKIGLDGIWGTSSRVENHMKEYVVYEGVETASFYGIPWYSVGWRASIGNRQWTRLSLGYEGTLMTFKHTYRYYHGLALSADF
ncbi:MAG: hypothetical protein AABY54_07090 [Deltaproteobacteria bacterium]